MKICQTCRQQFTNPAQRFCPHDGTLLSQQPAATAPAAFPVSAAASRDQREAPAATANQSPAVNTGDAVHNSAPVNGENAVSVPASPAAASAAAPFSPPSQHNSVPPQQQMPAAAAGGTGGSGGGGAVIAGTGKKRSWLGNLVGSLTAKAPTATIEIDRPGSSYRPGETVKARIRIAAPDAVSVNQIYAGLLFEEQCKEIELRESSSRDDDGYSSTETEEVVTSRTYSNWLEQQKLANQTELPAGFDQTFEFEYRIPPEIRPTYAGNIAQLNAKVRVYLDRPAASDVTTETVVPIVVPFTGAEEPIRNYIRVTAPGDPVQISFWLPRLNYLQGETVTGRVVIESAQKTKFRSISLAHTRLETTMGGDRQHGGSWTEQTVQLAGQTELPAGAPATFDFSLALPAKWQPTYRSEKSRSVAALELKLNVPWGRDVSAAQEIYIHTA